MDLVYHYFITSSSFHPLSVSQPSEVNSQKLLFCTGDGCISGGAGKSILPVGHFQSRRPAKLCLNGRTVCQGLAEWKQLPLASAPRNSRAGICFCLPSFSYFKKDRTGYHPARHRQIPPEQQEESNLATEIFHTTSTWYPNPIVPIKQQSQ